MFALVFYFKTNTKKEYKLLQFLKLLKPSGYFTYHQV